VASSLLSPHIGIQLEMSTAIDRYAPSHHLDEAEREGVKGDNTTFVIDSQQDVAYRPLVKDSFSYFSVFSLAFSCINSWVAIIYGLSAGLNSGGPTTRKLLRESLR